MKYPGTTVILFLFSLLLPLASLTQRLQIQSPVRFLALGDSYTIGQSVSPTLRWPVQLSDSLIARGYALDTLKIIATTGWRTDNLINAIKNQHLEFQNYNLVSLLIGVNNQYQGRPFSQYVAEFPALLDSAIHYAGGDKSKVFIVSIPDYAYTPFGQQSSNPGQISAEIDQYNAFVKQIADNLQIAFFDITPISRLGLQHPNYVANDGLHPSGIQYTEWVKLILEYIDNEITGIKHIEDTQLEVDISPNPTSDHITIDIPASTQDQKYDLRIYNLTGKLMSEQSVRGTSFSISLENMPDGLYFLKINSGDRQTVKKVLKKN
ncbi:MAG: T9SS type A sorting domain-containing protein [Saprospiraceae bacterium]|uniref:T9SS type A sorting domain-containing protein n=1 Tax=Candidatus Opimibacter skivensis TaxID=2982028 RepID=A0A9D7SPH3_9BACT|nr:T9SS type A sorting domain-containing protein [Candidatus Opimibacter skivensis]